MTNANQIIQDVYRQKNFMLFLQLMKEEGDIETTLFKMYKHLDDDTIKNIYDEHVSKLPKSRIRQLYLTSKEEYKGGL